jgi:hypothetical protein
MTYEGPQCDGEVERRTKVEIGVFPCMKCVWHVVIKVHSAFKKQDKCPMRLMKFRSLSGLVLNIERAVPFHSMYVGMLRSWR